PLAGKRDAIERLAILLPLRLAHRAGGEDEIALDDIAHDVAAGALAEDSVFVPAGALDPFAAVVAAAEARSDAHAQRGADLLDFANAADDREFRDRVHGYPFLLSVSPRALGSCRRSLGVRLTKSRARQASTRKERAGRSAQAEDGGGRRFCRARNSAVRPKGKIVDREPLRRGSAGLKPPDDRGTHGYERERPRVSLASFSVLHFSQHLALRALRTPANCSWFVRLE